MGILESITGGVTGGSANSSMLSPIFAEILGGQGMGGGQASQPGLGGLLQRFTQAGHGDVASSWVSNGPNQPIEPSALQNVFGQGQVNQWSQQTGLPPHDLLGQLAQFLPHAINQMTPDGQLPVSAGQQSGASLQTGSAFDGPGMP